MQTGRDKRREQNNNQKWIKTYFSSDERETDVPCLHLKSETAL